MLCQKANKAGQSKVPIVERTVISEPFQQIAFDLVGPLPRSRGGAQYILTAACMAMRWPEAVPLKSILAKAVADAMLKIFGRTRIPSQTLTDRGTQFTGSSMKEMCVMLGMDRVITIIIITITITIILLMVGRLLPTILNLMGC